MAQCHGRGTPPERPQPRSRIISGSICAGVTVEHSSELLPGSQQSCTPAAPIPKGKGSTYATGNRSRIGVMFEETIQRRHSLCARPVPILSFTQRRFVSRSIQQRWRSLPDANTRPVGAAHSGGRNSVKSSNRTVQQSAMNGKKPKDWRKTGEDKAEKKARASHPRNGYPDTKQRSRST